MKVLYLAAVYPQTRVSRWLRSLSKMGCECVVAFGRYGNDIWKGTQAVEIHFTGNPNNPFARGRYDCIRSELKKLQFVPDIIIAYDIFLSITGQRLSQRYRVPLILDIADNYPEVARQCFGSLHGPIAEYLLNKLEQKACQWADAITFVSQDSMEHVSKKHRIDLSEKRWVLPNFPMREDIDEVMTEATLSESLDDSNIVKGIYIGDFNPKIRDFVIVLKGLRYYNTIANGPKVQLVILAAQMDKMKEYFYNLDSNYEELVTIKPVIPCRMLQRELRQFNFGLVPHFRSRATDYTVPNKLFDYLLAGLPFLASNNPAIVNMVAKFSSFGEFYDPRVSETFERALSQLILRNEDYKKKLRLSATELRRVFCWNPVFEKYWKSNTAFYSLCDIRETSKTPS